MGDKIMPDPTETEPIVDPVVEPVVEPVEPVVELVEPAEPAAEPKESIVDKIGNLISSAKNAITGGGDEGDDIPDEFTEAADKMGWSEDQIKEFVGDPNDGGYTNEQLLEMIPSLTGADAAKAVEPAKATVVQEPDPEPKVEDSQDDEKLKPLLDRIAELEKAQGIQDDRSEQEKAESLAGKASDLFDKASEEFEVFGKTEDLPAFPDGRLIPTSPQMKARNEVWTTVQQLKQAGMSDDEALEFSMNAYKGKNLVTETKRNVIRDLKIVKLGGKRTSNEVASGDNKKLSGPGVIQEVARRHGHEMHD